MDSLQRLQALEMAADAALKRLSALKACAALKRLSALKACAALKSHSILGA
jgi:hypothetical protein